VRGPDSQRERLGRPVSGEKRSHRREEDDEEDGRCAKKPFEEEREELDEGLGDYEE